MIKKWPTIWERYFGSGKLIVVGLGENSATAREIDCGSKLPSRLTVIGWGEFSLELARAKEVCIPETKCVDKADDCCGFHKHMEIRRVVRCPRQKRSWRVLSGG
jgi:hypothetical protein